MGICGHEHGVTPSPLPQAHLAEQGKVYSPTSAKSVPGREFYGHRGTSMLPEQLCQPTNQPDRASGAVICSQHLGVAAVEVEGGVGIHPDTSSIQPGLPAPGGSTCHHVNRRLLGPCSFGFLVSTWHSNVVPLCRLHYLCSNIQPAPGPAQAWPYPRSRWQIALGSLMRAGCQSLLIPAMSSTCWGSLGRWQLLAQEIRSIVAPSKWHHLGLQVSICAKGGCPGSTCPLSGPGLLLHARLSSRNTFFVPCL